MAIAPNASSPSIGSQRPSLPAGAAGGSRIQNRPAPDRTADAAGSAAMAPRALNPDVQPAVIRTYACVPSDEALRSQVEEEDPSGTLVLRRAKAAPYDPQPVRRPVLDLLA